MALGRRVVANAITRSTVIVVREWWAATDSNRRPSRFKREPKSLSLCISLNFRPIRCGSMSSVSPVKWAFHGCEPDPFTGDFPADIWRPGIPTTIASGSTPAPDTASTPHARRHPPCRQPTPRGLARPFTRTCRSAQSASAQASRWRRSMAMVVRILSGLRSGRAHQRRRCRLLHCPPRIRDCLARAFGREDRGRLSGMARRPRHEGRYPRQARARRKARRRNPQFNDALPLWNQVR